MKINKSKEWWLAKLELEGESFIGAGGLAVPEFTKESEFFEAMDNYLARLKKYYVDGEYVMTATMAHHIQLVCAYYIQFIYSLHDKG